VAEANHTTVATTSAAGYRGGKPSFRARSQAIVVVAVSFVAATQHHLMLLVSPNTSS
jgi:hypothetical protein